jgi:hypothetical protein
MKRELKDYYQTLGLTREATGEDIRKAYILYAAKFHPDKHDGDVFFEERFKEVKEAYETLSDYEGRWKYDLRKFRKSKVKRQVVVDFEDVREVPAEPVRKFKFDTPHLDLYIALFYFVNVCAWVLIRRIESHAPSGILIRSLFLSVVSALLMWLFINGIIEIVGKKYNGRRVMLAGYFLLGIVAAYFAL